MAERPEHHQRNSKPKERAVAGVTVREMELEDLPTVFALGERLFTAEKWPNLYRTWDEYELVDMFSADGEYCLVAEFHDTVVGFALGTFIEKRRSAWAYGYVVWLGVAPEMKRSGVGTRLLNRLTDLFIEDGARMMLVDTAMETLGAIEFFRRQGFGHELEHLYLTRNLSTHPEYLRKRSERRQEASSRAGRRGPTGASIPAFGNAPEDSGDGAVETDRTDRPAGDD